MSELLNFVLLFIDFVTDVKEKSNVVASNSKDAVLQKGVGKSKSEYIISLLIKNDLSIHISLPNWLTGDHMINLFFEVERLNYDMIR